MRLHWTDVIETEAANGTEKFIQLIEFCTGRNVIKGDLFYYWQLGDWGSVEAKWTFSVECLFLTSSSSNSFKSATLPWCISDSLCFMLVSNHYPAKWLLAEPLAFFSFVCSLFLSLVDYWLVFIPSEIYCSNTVNITSNIFEGNNFVWFTPKDVTYSVKSLGKYYYIHDRWLNHSDKSNWCGLTERPKDDVNTQWVQSTRKNITIIVISWIDIWFI